MYELNRGWGLPQTNYPITPRYTTDNFDEGKQTQSIVIVNCVQMTQMTLEQSWLWRIQGKTLSRIGFPLPENKEIYRRGGATATLLTVGPCYVSEVVIQ